MRDLIKWIRDYAKWLATAIRLQAQPTFTGTVNGLNTEIKFLQQPRFTNNVDTVRVRVVYTLGGVKVSRTISLAETEATSNRFSTVVGEPRNETTEGNIFIPTDLTAGADERLQYFFGHRKALPGDIVGQEKSGSASFEFEGSSSACTTIINITAIKRNGTWLIPDNGEFGFSSRRAESLKANVTYKLPDGAEFSLSELEFTETDSNSRIFRATIPVNNDEDGSEPTVWTSITEEGDFSDAGYYTPIGIRVTGLPSSLSEEELEDYTVQVQGVDFHLEENNGEYYLKGGSDWIISVCPSKERYAVCKIHLWEDSNNNYKIEKGEIVSTSVSWSKIEKTFLQHKKVTINSKELLYIGPDINTDSDNNGVIYSYPDEYMEENYPGKIIRVDRAEIAEGEDEYAEINLALKYLSDQKIKDELKAKCFLKISVYQYDEKKKKRKKKSLGKIEIFENDPGQPFNLNNKKWEGDDLDELWKTGGLNLKVNGIRPGKVKIHFEMMGKFECKGENGKIGEKNVRLARDTIAMYITPTVSICPTGKRLKIWEGDSSLKSRGAGTLVRSLNTYGFKEESPIDYNDGVVWKYLKDIKGGYDYNALQRNDMSPRDFINFAQDAAIFVIHNHSGGETLRILSGFSSKNEAKKWGKELASITSSTFSEKIPDDESLRNEEIVFIVKGRNVSATALWYKKVFKTNLDRNKAISILLGCNTGNGKDSIAANIGVRVAIGTTKKATDSDHADNIEQLLDCLMRTKSSNVHSIAEVMCPQSLEQTL